MSKPEFHLRRVAADGSAGPVEVFPVSALPVTTQMGRRGFLGTGLTAAGVLSVLSGKAVSQNGRPATVVYAHNSLVTGLHVSADGKTLTSAGQQEGVVKQWALPEGKLVSSLAAPQCNVVWWASTPDAKALVVKAADGKTVRLFALPGGKPIGFVDKTGDVMALGITPDGKTLATATGFSDAEIKVWSLPDGAPLRTLPSLKGKARGFAFAPDNSALLVGGSAAVAFWSLAKNAAICFVEAGGELDQFAASPDARLLVGSVAGRWLRAWSLPDGAAIGRTEIRKALKRMVVSPNGKVLAGVGPGEKSIGLYSLPDGQPYRTLTGHTAEVGSLAVTPDGKTLISGDWDGVIRLWDLVTGASKGYLFDTSASRTDAYTYTVTDKVTNQTVTYTLPCGSPIPAGATCVCNCVPGTYKAPVARAGSGGGTWADESRGTSWSESTGGGGQWYGGTGGNLGGYTGGYGGSYCSCNLICTCIPVCQAHRLLDPDPVVRAMAERIVRHMRRCETEYLDWAAANAGGELRARIREVAAGDEAPAPWPDDCARYLDHPDEVVRIMAAQSIRAGGGSEDARVQPLLDEARRRPWFVRYGVR